MENVHRILPQGSNKNQHQTSRTCAGILLTVRSTLFVPHGSQLCSFGPRARPAPDPVFNFPGPHRAKQTTLSSAWKEPQQAELALPSLPACLPTLNTRGPVPADLRQCPPSSQQGAGPGVQSNWSSGNSSWETGSTGSSGKFNSERREWE